MANKVFKTAKDNTKLYINTTANVGDELINIGKTVLGVPQKIGTTIKSLQADSRNRVLTHEKGLIDKGLIPEHWLTNPGKEYLERKK